MIGNIGLYTVGRRSAETIFTNNSLTLDKYQVIKSNRCGNQNPIKNNRPVNIDFAKRQNIKLVRY
jgi:hypothetical protein